MRLLVSFLPALMVLVFPDVAAARLARRGGEFLDRRNDQSGTRQTSRPLLYR